MNTILNISSFKRTYNDKFNNNTSDYKIELIAEVNKTLDSKIEQIDEVAPESKRDKCAHEMLNEVKHSIGNRLVYSRNIYARKSIM